MHSPRIGVRKVLLAVAAAAGLWVPNGVAAATFTVNTSDDLDGTCSVEHCSLRQAINSANAGPGHDLIAFSIGAGGPAAIAVLGLELPHVIDPVTIDGTTQPGFAGVPLVQIDGTGVAPNPPRFPSGITLDADDNTIRGLSITGFVQDSFNSAGIQVNFDSSGNVIAGNYLGLDLTGAVAKPNARGIQLAASSRNTIGGWTVADRNVISGNLVSNIWATQGGTANVVAGNYIGTNAAGTAAAGPQNTGVALFSSDSIVGGSDPGAGNLISGQQFGVALGSGGSSDLTTGNVVQGNKIGTDAAGTGPIPNRVGVEAQASGNVIQSNLIAFNVEAGVFVYAGRANSILSNSIFGTASLGIELGGQTGPNPNDPGDADSGPNDLQNYPILALATSGNGSTEVDGTLDSRPSTTYRLQFFSNRTCDPSGFGEGETLLGDRIVTTDASGTVTFAFTFAGQAGDAVTATATDPDGNTSEFSNCTTAQLIARGTQTTLSPTTASNSVGTAHTVTATVVTATVPAQPLGGVTVFFTVSGSVATTGTCVTGTAGTCSFTYQGPSVPGADLITAYADGNGNGVNDADELAGAATKTWTDGLSTLGKATGGGKTAALDGSISFGFEAQNKNGTPKGSCNVVDAASSIHFKCSTVTSFVISGTHATFSGSGELNHTATTYRIDVDDLVDPGKGRDTFRITTSSGFEAGGVLTDGNIKIH